MGIKRIKASESKYFRGEMMTCAICGRVEKSNPHVSMGWNVIETNGRGVYVCPTCFENIQHFPTIDK